MDSQTHMLEYKLQPKGGLVMMFLPEPLGGHWHHWAPAQSGQRSKLEGKQSNLSASSGHSMCPAFTRNTINSWVNESLLSVQSPNPGDDAMLYSFRDGDRLPVIRGPESWAVPFLIPPAASGDIVTETQFLLLSLHVCYAEDFHTSPYTHSGISHEQSWSLGVLRSVSKDT